MKSKFDTNLVLKALKLLDEKLSKISKTKINLLVGGGGALIAAYNFGGVTTDIDAVVIGGSLIDIETEIRSVQSELKLPGDWINPHYSSFTIYLPKDYRDRMNNLYSGNFLSANALGKEDLLIMKFMAGREKDIPHIRFLIKSGVDLSIVLNRLEELLKIFPETAEKAIVLFDDIEGEC